MAKYIDYAADMKKDLLEQFKGKPRIEALVEVMAEQMQDLFDFFEQLRNERDVYNSVGKQLDGVGDIAVLTRMEAGKLMGDPIPVDIIEDDLYRQYLIYKILKNTCDCTYPDIIKAFRMFWDRALYYSEDPKFVYARGKTAYAVGVSGERVIPVASSTVIGGVRVCEGSGLTVGANGELSIDDNSLAERISAKDIVEAHGIW